MFAVAKSISIPEGVVTKIEDGNGVVLWKKDVEPAGPVNLVPLAIDTDGSAYNGGKGYIDGYRINSSGNQVGYAGTALTGYMPCAGISDADTIYINGVTVQNSTYCGITFCDAEFNVLYTARLGPDSFTTYNENQQIIYVAGSTCSVNGTRAVLDINFREDVYDMYPPMYFRVFAYGSGVDMVVSLNGEIA